MASGPYSAAMRLQLSASRSSASSQVMRSHFPSPRAPARFMGYRMRPSTLLWISRCDMPAPHTTPNDFGFSGSPSILTMLLSSSEYTKTPHRAWQVVHCVLVFLIAIAAPSFVTESSSVRTSNLLSPEIPSSVGVAGAAQRKAPAALLPPCYGALTAPSNRKASALHNRRLAAGASLPPTRRCLGRHASAMSVVACRPAAGGNRRTGRCAPCGRALDLL